MLNAEELNVTQNQFDALISFAFNLGLSALAGSTLWRLFAHGDIQGAANEFPKWIYAGGKLLEGLKRRRQAERELFLKH
jgi:lysozyme